MTKNPRISIWTSMVIKFSTRPAMKIPGDWLPGLCSSWWMEQSYGKLTLKYYFFTSLTEAEYVSCMGSKEPLWLQQLLGELQIYYGDDESTSIKSTTGINSDTEFDESKYFEEDLFHPD